MQNKKLMDQNQTLKQTMKATTFKLTILEQNLIAAQKEGGEQEVNEKLALSVKQVQVMI